MIDKPASGLSTYQHEAGPGRWTVGGQVDPVETAREIGCELAIAASERVISEYARRGFRGAVADASISPADRWVQRSGLDRRNRPG